MASKNAPINSLKKGSYVVFDNRAYRVADTQTSKSGKHGHAKIRIVAIGLLDSKKKDVVYPAHHTVEVPIIEKKAAQVMSITGDFANVMDVETFETFDLKIPEELKGKVVENGQIIFWDVLGQKVMKQLKSGVE